MASTTASAAMVVYWRDINASAPSRMAFEISRISGVPVSNANTDRARKRANTRPSSPARRAIHRKVLPPVSREAVKPCPTTVADREKKTIQKHPEVLATGVAGRPARRGRKHLQTG